MIHIPQGSYSKEELLACGRGEWAEGYPQLPLPPMLMFDRIAEVSTDGGRFGLGHLVAELDITPDLWFFGCHFHNDPVMPGCLGLDAMWQLVGFYLGWRGGVGRGRAIGVSEVKFTDQVLPSSQKVTYIVDIKRLIMRKLTMGIADARLLVDGREIYVATDLKVGLFSTSDKA